MFALLVIIHIMASLVLILVVLLQSGKAGDLASAFGGAGGQTAFGARGAATVLTRATTVCAVIFMITSLALSIMFSRAPSSTIMESVPFPEEIPVESTTEPSSVPTEEPSQAAPEEGSEQGQ